MAQAVNVAAEATQADQLSLKTTTLLGTRTGPNGPEALLRMGSGRIRRVQAGDRLGIGLTRVIAIANGQLRLATGRREQILTIPGS